ncbi:MAG: HAD family phosphatase [Planctomycetaceae bacterium]
MSRVASVPRIRAVAFDLDGLMFNTEEIFRHSGTELLRRRGITPPPRLFQSMMGRRGEEAFAVLVEMCGLREGIPELIIESETIFFERLDAHLQPMPGLEQLLARIELAGLNKGVATSSPRRYLHMLLDRFELTDRFHATLTAEDVTHGKPNPEIYLKAAAALGVEPAELLVLEDSEAGTRAAAAAGAHIISVPHDLSRDHDFSVAKGVASRLNDPLIMELFGLII